MDQPRLELTHEEITGITSFLGYGKTHKTVWFVGFEEALGKSTDDEARGNLKSRSRFDNVMDLREAHLNLKEGQKSIDIETKTSFTQVWLFIAKIMLARNGHKDWSDNKANRAFILENAKNYVRLNLGRRDGSTFLTELSPIPTRRTKDKDWMRELELLDENLKQKISIRTTRLKQLLQASKPSLVICYGNRADDFARLLDIEWQPVHQISKICASADSKRLLLPFFGFGRMNHSIIGDLLRAGMLN